MSSFAVVLDTCVLFPAALRDTLLRAAAEGLYQVRWSQDILEELRRNLVTDLNLDDDRVRELVTQMGRAFPEACVLGYEQLIPQMGNDPKDRHVLAAAVVSDAQAIVTTNSRHFPASALDPYDIQALTPDEFLSDLFDLAPDVMIQILIEQAGDLQNPPVAVEEVVANIERVAPQFAAAVLEELPRFTVSPGGHWLVDADVVQALSSQSHQC
jgi:predicted nucleic acid-binding protein